MPSVRVPSSPQNSTLALVAGILYHHDSPDPLRVSVLTVIPKAESFRCPRFPCIEGVIGSHTSTHDCVVTVIGANEELHRFLISCQYDADAEINATLEAAFPNSRWRGPLVVMRQGKSVFVTDMGGVLNQALAREAVRYFLLGAARVVEKKGAHSLPRVLNDPSR
ncbi:hypothetical protein BV25DRAFT_1921590 [Artomyces pyxidatus]|uniref:Uncharacterized protein n=2 Tax=Artomyces pyxidatus TaxID=48021 RepID=A0ACB8SIM3_9AGAM|nr:hypothetical protein BV25DRAFT_1921571 [Artomyces pyxidatus]KAI0055740.1 hypothetical protein BV25DRAFT_1921590 [Artomyces pyxidatus]